MEEDVFQKSKENKSSYLIPVSILVAGAVIALAIFYSGGSDGESKPKTAQQSPGLQAAAVGEAARLLEIQEGDFVLGNPSAPVLYVEFGDFQCPFCGKFFSETLPQLKEKYVKTGQVAFVWRDFAFLGQESFDAASAARCAGEQNKFWSYHDTLFSRQSGENRGAFSIDNLKNFASDLGLDTQQFNECLDSGKYISAVQDESQLGRKLGITGTPSSFVNGRNITGAVPFIQLEAIILEALGE